MTKHPNQEIIVDSDNKRRFRENPIVRYLKDFARTHGINLNDLQLMFDGDVYTDDWSQFCQLIGYSVNGYHELSFTDKSRLTDDDKTPPIADMLYDAMRNHSTSEWVADEALLKAFDVDPDEPGTWPMADIWYDDYDSSFEFGSVDPDWIPTRSQLEAAFALGFSRCWINYRDGTERYAAFNSMDTNMISDAKLVEFPRHDGGERAKLLSKIAMLEKRIQSQIDVNNVVIARLDKILDMTAKLEYRMKV